MAYCTITEVQNLNPQRTYSASTKPTQTQVEALIDQVAVEIDNILQAQGYTVPVTSPTNFTNHLKQVNAYGAAALAEMAMFPETQQGETPHGKQLYIIYKAWLDALRKGEIPASLAPGETSSPVGSFYHSMTDQEDFPDPAFRIRSEDKEF